MLLSFQIADEDGERVHLDPFAVESLREHDLGGNPVATIVLESGDRFRVRDPERDTVRRIVEARMALEEACDELCDPG